MNMSVRIGERHRGFLLALLVFVVIYTVAVTTETHTAVQNALRNMQVGYELEVHSDPVVRSAFMEWRECMEHKLKDIVNDGDNMWTGVPTVTKVCDELEAIKKIDMTPLANSDETKYHVVPKQEKTPSNIVTLGIGHDVQSETKLKPLLPPNSCFYGADPISEINQDLYTKLGGEYFPFAVGSECGTSDASVLIGEGITNYVTKKMLHIDIITFMKKFIKKDFYDDLLLDTEGAEYGMFPFFHKGGEFDRAGITICQFNLEIHAPTAVQKEQIRKFYHQILKDDRYSWHRPVQDRHARMFFLNHEHPECVRRYVAPFLRH